MRHTLSTDRRPRGYIPTNSPRLQSGAKMGIFAVLLTAGCLGGVVYLWRSAAVSQQEIDSRVRLYTERGDAIERQMNQTIEAWQQTGPHDPTHAGWRDSVAILEEKKAQFTELHKRHIEVLRAGQLTLGTVYAQLTDEALTGEKVFPVYVPGFYQRSRLFYSSRAYREPALERFDVAELSRLLADSLAPRQARDTALEQLADRCDASPACVQALVAVVAVDDLRRYWIIAANRLCAVGASPDVAGGALIRWLSRTSLTRDRYEIDEPLRTLKCIGYSDVAVVPYLVPILQAHVSDERERSRRRLAMQLLADVGPAAAAAIPALRAVSESGDEYSRSVALYALGRVEQK